MGRNNKPLSAEKIKLITELIKKNEPHRKIANTVKCSVASVSKIRKTIPNLTKINPPGRKKLIDELTERQIVRDIKSGTCETAVEIKKNLEENLNLKVSADTVRRTLRKSGLKGRAKVKKPLLTIRHRKLRLAFAKKYKNWTVSDWAKVLWSDETKINRFGSDGRQWTWRATGEPLQERHVRPTLKFGGGSVMIWGCMMANGTGNIHKIDGHMTSEYYINILKSHLAASATKNGFNRSDIIFQQDNDPKHTAKLTQKWLNDESIQVLSWPPQSPDLNPIEHLWGILKKSVGNSSTTTEELWAKVQQKWDDITPDICSNLVESMPRRINAVLKAKGGYTKY